MRDQPVPSISMLQNSLSNHGVNLSKTSRMYGVHAMQGSQDSMSDEFENLTKMKSSINKAYKQGKYCDVLIKSKDGAEVQAHKLILASQSKYFMRKFDAQPDAKELEISDIKGDAVKVIIDFLYTQKVKSNLVNKDNAKDVLKAGEMFNIEEVKEEAAIFMAKNLDEENAIDVMTNEVFVGAISNNAFTYAANNFQLIIEKDHLKKRLLSELNPNQLCHLLSQKNLMLWDKNGIYLDALEREKQLFFFVMGYMAHDCENRLTDLKRILTCLKLPILINGKILSVTLMGKGLKKKPEELAGMLADILEPFDNLSGKENLSTLFANDKKQKRSQSERRLLADTCKMRYASIPHSTACSDLASAQQPWGEKILFCPGLNEPKVAFNNKQVIRSLTIFTSNTSIKAKQKADDTNQFDRRVSGIKIKFDGGKEETIGMTDHHTKKEETYDLDQGEFITEVHTHHPTALINKPGNAFETELHSLTTIHDLSFETNKERRLGPMKESDLPLGIGLTMRVPSKIRHLEKNCPGKFCWLQGFGSEDIKVGDSEEKKTLYPIWGFQTHFKVYSIKNQEFDFVAGIKKLYQFSIEGIFENTKIDDLEDIYQIERSPVHEVVDLDDSDSNEEEESDGAIQPGMYNNEDSIMVVDSESEEEDEEDDDESFDESGYLGQGILPMGEMGYGYPPMNFRAPIDGQGGEDEPIEIASSSEGEQPNLADVEEGGTETEDKTSTEKSNGEGQKESSHENEKKTEENEKTVEKKDSPEVTTNDKKEKDKENEKESLTEDKEEETKEKDTSVEKEQVETPSKRPKRVSEKGGPTPNSKTKKGKVKKSPAKAKHDDKEEEKTTEEKSSETTEKECTKDKDTNKENSTENGDEVSDKKTRRKKEAETETTKPAVETPEKKGRPKRAADDKTVEDTPGKKKKRGVK